MALPDVGDILYRANAHVGCTELADNVVTILFKSYLVIKVTKHKMWITSGGVLQPWEAPPGHGDEANVRWALTEEQFAARLKNSRGSFSVRVRSARVMFAWPTKELALDSLRARTAFRVMHAQRALDRAKAVEAFLEDNTPEGVRLYKD